MKIKNFLWLFIVSCTILVLIMPVYAHQGRTDANGGHYDNETGEYHYHHGYEAHHHINGICPYNYDDQTNHTSGTSYSDVTPKPELHIETPDPHSPAISYVTATPILEENKVFDNLPLIIVAGSITIIITACIIASKLSNLASEKRGYEKLSENLKKKYETLESELKAKYDALEKTYMKQQETKVAEDKKLLEDILRDKKQSCPTMAKVFADYEYYIANNTARYLNGKKNPAKKAAENVKEFGKRNRELMKQIKELEYQIRYYEIKYPFIKQIEDETLQISLLDDDNNRK